jgi:hypothetical protein
MEMERAKSILDEARPSRLDMHTGIDPAKVAGQLEHAAD